PAQSVSQIASIQAEDASHECWNIEQSSIPGLKQLAARDCTGDKFENRRPEDQRQHQQFIDVEGKTDRSNDADQPLHGGQTLSGTIGSECGHRAIGGGKRVAWLWAGRVCSTRCRSIPPNVIGKPPLCQSRAPRPPLDLRVPLISLNSGFNGLVS